MTNEGNVHESDWSTIDLKERRRMLLARAIQYTAHRWSTAALVKSNNNNIYNNVNDILLSPMKTTNIPLPSTTTYKQHLAYYNSRPSISSAF